MGIRGVWTFFRSLFKTIDPINENTKCIIGIDMFSLVYTHRANMDELLQLLKSWSDNGYTIKCIWDGTAPKEKQEIIGQRRSARDSAQDKKKGLETYLEEYGTQLTDNDIKHIKTAITSLSWQSWHLTGPLKKEIKEKLGEKVEHIYAEGEADDTLLDLAFEKQIDIILTLDSDIFAMGAQRIWRLLRIRGEWITEDISVESVCNNWGISLGMLQDASFLAGWDRCHPKGTSYMPFETALTRVKHYGGWQQVLEKNPSNIPIDLEAVECLKKLKRESRDRWIKLMNSRV
jgi:hypothetical protein